MQTGVEMSMFFVIEIFTLETHRKFETDAAECDFDFIMMELECQKLAKGNYVVDYTYSNCTI